MQRNKESHSIFVGKGLRRSSGMKASSSWVIMTQYRPPCLSAAFKEYAILMAMCFSSSPVAPIAPGSWPRVPGRAWIRERIPEATARLATNAERPAQQSNKNLRRSRHPRYLRNIEHIAPSRLPPPVLRVASISDVPLHLIGVQDLFKPHRERPGPCVATRVPRDFVIHPQSVT